jgi:hypothetical protein
MSLPEFVAPVVTVVGVPAVVWVVLRYFPQAVHALVALVAGIVAIASRDDKRRESCHRVLDKVTRHDSRPPPGPRRTQISRRRRLPPLPHHRIP